MARVTDPEQIKQIEALAAEQGVYPSAPANFDHVGSLIEAMRATKPAPRGRTMRHEPGRMNKTEAAYAQHLDDRKKSGEVVAWWFEAIKFRLADKTWYAPDFLVMLADGTLELHETKGFMEDDAAVKIKVASSLYAIFVLRLVKREKGQWVEKIVSAN